MHTNNPRRNIPNQEGRNNDPDLRDESAVQPGINTISNSDYDDNNEELTQTGKDDFRTVRQEDKNADPSFDEKE